MRIFHCCHAAQYKMRKCLVALFWCLLPALPATRTAWRLHATAKGRIRKTPPNN
jgi:hypothetical protein